MARRVRIYKPGGWDHLIIEDFVCPDPANDEVKVEVKAAGINFADVSVRQGHYSSAKKFIGWPITPGFEVAGKVIKVGKEVTDFKIGDKVMGTTFFGGYSSEINLKKEYTRKMPPSFDYAQAASTLAVFATAYYAVHWLARIHKGSTALVHSVAGGVGLSLTQLLKETGCKVVGVVGKTSKVDVAYKYGADFVIDKSKVNLWTEAEAKAPKGFDLIFDPNGVSTFQQSYNHLSEGGLLFIYGFASMLSKTKGHRNIIPLAIDYVRTPRFSPFNMVKTNRSVMAFNLSYFFEKLELWKSAFDFIVKKFEDGTLKPLPVIKYAFEDVAKAHQDIESGRTTGKLVLIFK